MRIAMAVVLLPALVFATAARADDACGPLKLVNIIPMVSTLDGNGEVVPVVIGGKPRSFLLDTGGYISQISRPLADELKLPPNGGRPGAMYDVTGNSSNQQVRVPELGLGQMTDQDVGLMVSSSLGTSATNGPEGILAPDLLAKYDVELDFGSDRLNLFSPDHCPGHVTYWSAPAVAVIPIALEQTRFAGDWWGWTDRRVAPDLGLAKGFHITVPVTLDGHQVKALLDTGTADSALRMDDAEGIYGLRLGSPDTPARGNLNGDTSLKTYSHLFKSLSFGTISINNQRLLIFPNAMGRNAAPSQLVANRARTERDLVNAPEMILGMDILKRLRIYFAFQEEKMYVSASSAPTVGTIVRSYPKEFLTTVLERLDGIVAGDPDDAGALDQRCFWRALAKSDLDGALADCDKSLKLEPRTATALDNRAFVLFQQGKYQEALAGYTAALAVDRQPGPSLLMRGLIKGKLGDASGKQADIASATHDDPNIAADLKEIGIDE